MSSINAMLKDSMIQAYKKMLSEVEEVDGERAAFVAKSYRKALEEMEACSIEADAIVKLLKKHGEMIASINDLLSPECDFDCQYPATYDGCKECPKGG